MLESQILNEIDYSAKERIASKIREKFPEGVERILLINPPQTKKEAFDLKMAQARSYPCYPPYNLALLCRALGERDYTTDILDINYEILDIASKAKDEFDYDVWKKILYKKLDEFRPDLVGVTCMYTMIHPEMKEITDHIKDYNKNIPIIAGGAHPALAAEEVLRKTESIDFVSLYESDNSFADMVDFINGKNSLEKLIQLATIFENEFVQNAERDSPDSERISVYPEWHNLPLGDYTQIGKIGVYASWMQGEDTRCCTILSSRGCRANCDFCSVRAFNGMGVRHRSIESVVDEIEILKNTYRIEHFVWLDDDLFAGRKETERLFSEIAKRKLGITWDASNGVIASCLTPQLAQLAEQSGCIGMSFGVESGDPQILRQMRKPASLEKFVVAAEIMKKHPAIFTKGFLIIGYPGETIGQIWNTIGLAKQMHLDWYTLQKAIPLPATDMAKKMYKMGEIESQDITKEAQNRFMSGFGNTAAREYERKRKLIKEDFYNILLDKPKDHVPNRDELTDMWFLADYYINFEDIPKENNLIKLQLKEKWLEEVCMRKSSENPIGNLYLAVIRDKIGKHEQAGENRKLARQYIKESAFWSIRFTGLGLDKLLEQSK